MMSLLWAITGLLLILSEFIVPEFVIFFFGVGALLTSLITAITPFVGNSLLAQILIWLALSGVSVFALRGTFKKWLAGTVIEPEDRAEYSGQTARVVQTITPETPGRISFKGTTWKAISYDQTIEEGETIEILTKEGMTFVVARSLLAADLPDIDDESTK